MGLFTDGVFGDQSGSGGGTVTGTATRIPFFGGSGTLTESASFLWDDANTKLTLGTATIAASTNRLAFNTATPEAGVTYDFRAPTSDHCYLQQQGRQYAMRL